MKPSSLVGLLLLVVLPIVGCQNDQGGTPQSNLQNTQTLGPGKEVFVLDASGKYLSIGQLTEGTSQVLTVKYSLQNGVFSKTEFAPAAVKQVPDCTPVIDCGRSQQAKQDPNCPDPNKGCGPVSETDKSTSSEAMGMGTNQQKKDCVAGDPGCNIQTPVTE